MFKQPRIFKSKDGMSARHLNELLQSTAWPHLNLGAGGMQPINCLNIQDGQAVQSMGRSIDWKLEDSMVDGLFFQTALTGRRGGHTPFG